MEVAPMSRDLTKQTFGCYAGVRHLPALHRFGGRAGRSAAGKYYSGYNFQPFVLFCAVLCVVGDGLDSTQVTK